MTVIVYRDGVMAADTEAKHRDFLTHGIIKIVSNSKFVVGVSGSSPYIYTLNKVFTDEYGSKMLQNEHQFPKIEVDKDGYSKNQLLVWNKLNHSLTMITSDGIEYLAHCPYFAIGAGAEFAMGALSVGATAEEAVEACIRNSPYCGGNVYSVKTK